MIGCAFRGVLGKSARAENCQAEPNGHGGRRKVGPPAKAGLGVEQDFGIKKKTASRIDVRQTCHPFSSLDLWRICCNARPEGTRASISGRRERKKRKFVSSFSAS